MVDTVYRMAPSPYLYPGQPAEERLPIQPYGAFSIGANEMSTLDMASGIQTIANEGVHMQPYFVEYIDDACGERVYTHSDPGTQVLDRQVALTAIDMLKGVLTGGTARGELADFASRQPAFGKTGTQEKNWTAFFVGATPFLSTAVLVRDPDRYTPMADIPEFAAAGVDRVQGGTFPARIWGSIHGAIGLERVGLDATGTARSARSPAGAAVPAGRRMRLRGRRLRAGRTRAASEPGRSSARSTISPASRRRASGRPRAPPDHRTARASRLRTSRRRPSRRPRRRPSSTRFRNVTEPEPPATTLPPRPVLSLDQTGTTIAPDVLDPHAPLPSVPLERRCAGAAR